MNNKNYHVIFDLDGTVLDTEYEVAVRTAEIAGEVGLTTSANEVFARFGGLSFLDKLRGIAKLEDKTLSAEDITYLNKRLNDLKDAMLASFEKEIVINAGVPTVLQKLADDGHLISLASSNISAHSKFGLTMAGLIDYFGTRIYGSDHAGDRKKPDPGIYIHAMAEHASTSQNTIAVEDSEPGVRAGHAAGAYVIAYLDPRFGTGELAAQKEETFRKAGANAVIRSFDDFMKAMPVKKSAPKPQAPKI